MRIIVQPEFRKALKRLNKKYPSMPTDYEGLLESLQNNPLQGAPLGNHCFKVRMAIAAKRTGKSGGARVITCVRVLNDTIHLLTLYDKSEIDNISDAFLKQLIEAIEE